MATFSFIGGAEPSTLTFKAATVTQTRNSSVKHQELISLADPDSSLAVAAVLAGNPASTAWGLVVRGAGPFATTGDSTCVQGTNPWTIAGNSTVVVSQFAAALISSAVQAGGSSALNVRNVWSSTHADQPVQASILNGNSSVIIHGDSTVIQGTNPWLCAITSPLSSAAPNAGDSGVIVRQVGYSTIVSVAAFPANSSQVEVRALPANSSQVEVRNAVALSAANSSGFPSSGSSGLVVRQVWDIRATAASTNAMSASTAFSVASSAVGKVYVTAYSITSTVQAPTVLRFMSGSTLLWPVVLAALSSAVTGVNLSGYPFLFVSPAAGRPLTLNIASTVAGFRVGVSYFRAP